MVFFEFQIMLPAPKPFCSKSLAVSCILFHVDYYILPDICKRLCLKFTVRNPIIGRFQDSIEIPRNQIDVSIECFLDEKIFAESYLDSYLIQFLTIIVETTNPALSYLVS